MVSTPMTAKNGHHLRSKSFPSTSHPLTTRVEENLIKLRCWIALESSSLECRDALQDGFSNLIGLFDSVEDLLQLPCTQRVLAQHHHQSCVDRVLEGTLRVLDVTGSTQDVLLQVKEYVQHTKSDLRRSGHECEQRSHLVEYLRSSRKSRKLIHKYLGGLRNTVSEHPVTDQFLLALTTVLGEVEAVTLKVCHTLLHFISESETVQKQSSWSLVSKMFNSKRIGEDQTVRYNAERRLTELEVTIANVEQRLEGLFKRVIRTRVTLLNILSN